MNITTNPIYNKYFPANGPTPSDWESFRAFEPLNKKNPKLDFSINTEKTWQTTAKTVAITLLKIIILPWGLYEATKGLIDRIAMLAVYPAQIIFSEKEITTLRKKLDIILQVGINTDFIGREVTLEKEGHRYNGFMLGHSSSISNGKWALFAPGNAVAIEQIALEPSCLSPYLDAGYNILMVNGPGVGKSQGLATVNRIGDAQEAALSFLESAIKAKQIAMAGQSLGGAAMGLATMKHQFKPDVHYLSLKIMTFDRLSHIVKKIAGSFASLLIRGFGCEMDTVAASKKLQQLGIHEVIFQAEYDEVVEPEVSLLQALQKENMMENKTASVIPNTTHCHLPNEQIYNELIKWDQSLAPAEAI